MVFIGLNKKSIHWTNHSKMKMQFYGLSESRVQRILRAPKRIEGGVADGTVAMMQPAGSQRNPYEVWVMVEQNQKLKCKNQNNNAKFKNLGNSNMIKVISVWKYPGRTKPRSEALLNILNNEYSEYDEYKT